MKWQMRHSTTKDVAKRDRFDAFSSVNFIPLLVRKSHVRHPMGIFRKRFSTQSMFTLFQSRNCNDVWWQCKWNSFQSLRFDYFHWWNLFVSLAMYWATKSSDIQFALITKDMREMHFISIYVLFVIRGDEPFNMNPSWRNFLNIL